MQREVSLGWFSEEQDWTFYWRSCYANSQITSYQWRYWCNPLSINPLHHVHNAEEVHASGVMAVVCGGLYLAYHNIHILSSSSRIRGINVWHSFTFLLNGLVFLLIGLGLPDIVEGLKKRRNKLIWCFYFMGVFSDNSTDCCASFGFVWCSHCNPKWWAISNHC